MSLTNCPAYFYAMKYTKRIAIVLCILSSAATAALAATPTTTMPPPQAAVAMADRFSAEVAAQVLKDGGNAVDAAVAAVFVLAVTSPDAGNIGGGGFMISLMDGVPEFLDFRERAPLTARRDMYLDEQGEVMGDQPFTGTLSVGVPGTVRGMQQAHDRHGSLPWQRLLQPAIALARDGFVVPAGLAKVLSEETDRFVGRTNFFSYFSKLGAGEKLKQPELAATLQRIAADPNDFYTGKTARLLTAQMQRDGGLITAADLESYRAVWRQPVLFSWRGYQLITPAPPSSGGIALAQLLGMHEAAAAHFDGVARNSAQYLHLLAEIEKRVFADRGKFLGDPDFKDNPVQQLIAPAYLKRRAGEINPRAMSPAEAVAPGLEGTDTTHLSVVDGYGNAVAITYTLNWEFGSGVVVEGAGFLLNDEMDDFSAKAGVPNKFGVVGAELNAIAPGKRMLSSMSPTILTRSGNVAAVLGTQGGSTIFTSVFQTLLNVFEFDMSAQAAVDADRFHHQLPQAKLIRYDGNRSMPDSLIRQMGEYGYRLEPNSWGNLGNVQLVLRRNGELEAASDIRGRGKAMVIPLTQKN
jgi:gamma-glutamyltranspeptidase/glutathione hydrolase